MQDDQLVPIPRSTDTTTTSSADLESEIYPETSGPRSGIFLSFENADRLIQHHTSTPTFGKRKQLDKLFYFKRGYNNRVYMAKCTDETEYVIRLQGKFWDHQKIMNETQAILLAGTVLNGIVPLPTIIGTSGGGQENQEKIIPYDYIIMSRLEGVPLDTVWDTLTTNEKKIVLDQVVKVYAALQTIELTRIGNFVKTTKENDSHSNLGSIIHNNNNNNNNNPDDYVGPLMEGSRLGCFESWREFVGTNIESEIEIMLKRVENFKEIEKLLPRLKKLVQKIQSGELEIAMSSSSSSPSSLLSTFKSNQKPSRPISFMHGDFESRNMLVVGTTLTGLHDFEFAGGFPTENEWCTGFEWIFARTEDPFDESEQEKITNMTKDEKEVLEYFLKALEKNGIDRNHGEDHEWKSMLYHAQVNIAPWWLREVDRKDWPERHEKSMKVAEASLIKTLERFGC